MKEKLTSRDIQAQETRKKLLETAMELIAKEGYRSVTVSRICKACGVSVGTFYLYFQSKRDVITLLNRQHNEYLSKVCELDAAKTASEMYQDYVRKYMEYIADSGVTLSRSLLLGMLEDSGDDEDAGLELQEQFLGQLLEHGRRTGEFTAGGISDREFFELFLVTINGIIATWLFSNGKIDVVAYGCFHAGQLIRLLQ